MKVIMFLDNGYDPDVRVYKEAKYLVKKGVQVDVFCWDRDQYSMKAEDEWSEGIHIIRAKIPSKFGSGKKQIPAFLRFAKKCKQYVRNEKCDYIHCHDFVDAVIARFFCHLKVPYVFDMHEYYEKDMPSRSNIIHILVEKIISDSLASLYENDVYLEPPYSSVRQKLFPLKNYPDATLVKKKPKIKSDVFRIGYHGAVRNQVKQFRALSEAVKGMHDVRVDINGLGIDLPMLKKMEKEYNNVYVHGAFDGTKELTKLYQNTDVLFCGYDKADPNMQGCAEIVKYFEAILTGTPMIATEGLAVGRRVKENDFGIAVDTDDPFEIRDAIELLKSDSSLYKKYAENENKNSALYDWNKAVSVLDIIYGLS